MSETYTQKLDEMEKSWQREVDYVTQNQKMLRILYGNQSIAVHNQRVVCYGSDEIKMAAEIQKKFPNAFVILGTLDDIVNPKEEHI